MPRITTRQTARVGKASSQFIRGVKTAPKDPPHALRCSSGNLSASLREPHTRKTAGTGVLENLRLDRHERL